MFENPLVAPIQNLIRRSRVRTPASRPTKNSPRPLINVQRQTRAVVRARWDGNILRIARGRIGSRTKKIHNVLGGSHCLTNGELAQRRLHLAYIQAYRRFESYTPYKVSIQSSYNRIFPAWSRRFEPCPADQNKPTSVGSSVGRTQALSTYFAETNWARNR